MFLERIRSCADFKFSKGFGKQRREIDFSAKRLHGCLSAASNNHPAEPSPRRQDAPDPGLSTASDHPPPEPSPRRQASREPYPCPLRQTQTPATLSPPRRSCSNHRCRHLPPLPSSSHSPRRCQHFPYSPS
jgi:hypothetical protein